MADKVYPEGVTSLDHMKHDMKMGRFPNQSSVGTFLKERATLAAQEEVAHLPAGASLHDEMVEALKTAQSALAMLTEPKTIQSTNVRDAWGIAVEAERKCRSVLAKITGNAPDPA